MSGRRGAGAAVLWPTPAVLGSSGSKRAQQLQAAGGSGGAGVALAFAMICGRPKTFLISGLVAAMAADMAPALHTVCGHGARGSRREYAHQHATTCHGPGPASCLQPCAVAE